MKRKYLRHRSVIAGLLVVAMFFTGCKSTVETNAVAKSEEKQSDAEEIVIGFSQLGAESDWRSANTESMKSTFTSDKGYTLIVEDAQQQQANQIMAIRTFIQQEVDYIVLAPVTETGWETVLQEAQDAKIPVIIVDRQVAVDDPNLFACWVGSDFELEGKKAAEWLHQFALARGIAEQDIRIADIQGTLGGSAQIGRTDGLHYGVKKYGWNLVEEIPGEFTQAKGREAMETILKDHSDVNVVYCENDNEALGAIEAITAAGRKVGSDIAAGDIMVMSFDGVTKNIMEHVKKDEITFIGECNPHHGPRVEVLIQQLEAGKTPDKYSYVVERSYAHDATVPSVEVDGVSYPMTVVDETIMDEFDEKK